MPQKDPATGEPSGDPKTYFIFRCLSFEERVYLEISEALINLCPEIKLIMKLLGDKTPLAGTGRGEHWLTNGLLASRAQSLLLFLCSL
jgi:hypothetical protein